MTDEPVTDRTGASFRKPIVVGVGADASRIAGDGRLAGEALGDLGSDGRQRLLRIRTELGFVEIEQSVADDRDTARTLALFGRHRLNTLGDLPGSLRLLNFSQHLP